MTTMRVPATMIASPIKYVAVGFSWKMTKDKKVPINGDTAY